MFATASSGGSTAEIALEPEDQVGCLAMKPFELVEPVCEARHLRGLDIGLGCRAGADAVEQPGRADIEDAGQHGKAVGPRLGAVALPGFECFDLHADAAGKLCGRDAGAVPGPREPAAERIVIGKV